MKTNKIIYYIATGLLTAMTLMAVTMYFTKTADIAAVFESIGVSGSLVYPFGVAKLLGLVGIWFGKPRILKELAYVGFGIVFISAIIGHLSAGDGQWFGPIIPLVLAAVSFIFHRRLNATPTANQAIA